MEVARFGGRNPVFLAGRCALIERLVLRGRFVMSDILSSEPLQ